ncbi:hypothetical protein A7A08_01533 [Methyloligella halotolerans]|uniref:Uncharacterized protein n=1 Tax=Methyloligella halotolerans TaxID=1177755 RepID=A0A1E2RZB2_9HYPH|nr:hypothetical protein [Methyloligella halotolerans]ODA67500.1 hypothetical protein A7A08_01533 [Methyloligella halotolerans]
MSRTTSERIDTLFRIDKICAIGFVVVLWASVIYVFVSVSPFVDDMNVKIAIGAAGAAVLIFNTASIFAMLRHYADDKEDIYGIDIRHKDALVALKKSGRLDRQLAE